MSFKRDSIGRSDGYNNPYDTRYVSNPSIKKFRAEGSQDTIESQQAILERNLLRQMQEGYFKLPKGALLYVVYLGKGLFFVMMIPTYLFFYGMPKWLLMQGGPAIMKGLRKASKRVKEQFREKVLAHIQEIARKVAAQIEKFGRAINEISNSAADVLKNAKLFSEKLKDITAESLRRMTPSMEPFRKATASVKTAASWARAKSSAMGEGAAAIYKKATEAMASPFQGMSTAISETIKKYRSISERVSKSIGEAIEKNLLNPLRTVQKNISEMAKKIAQPIVDAYKKRVLEPYRKIADKVKKTIENIVEVVRERQEKIRELALNVAHKTSELAHKAADKVGPAALAIANGIVNMIPQPVINFFVPIALAAGAVWRTSGHMKRGGKKLIERLKAVKEWTKSTSKWVIAQVMKAGQQLAKGINWVAEQLQKAPSKAWKFICAAAIIAVEAGKRIFFLLRLLFAWIKVLFKYGLWEVRKLVS